MSWFRRLVNSGRSARISRDIDREMEFHIAERADELRAAGLSEPQAMLEARRRFGNRGIQKERTRDADIVVWLDSLAADVRYALRALRRSPAFAAVAVASLALGIGANTAIFTLIDALVLRTLPVPHPDELVQVTLGGTDGSGYFTNPLWEQLRDRQTGLAPVAAFGETDFDISEGGAARRVRGAWVSGEYFALFGVQPALGRVLAPADDVRGCPPVAVLSHDFWRASYGGASDVVGRTIPLDGHRFEIVGVAAPGFRGPEVGWEAQVHVPICSKTLLSGEGALDQRSAWWLRVMGRRAPGLGTPQVAARLAAIAPASYAATLPDEWPEEHRRQYLQGEFGAVPAASGMSALRERYGGALTTLMGAVGLVLLIACANVANLLLARGAAREREVAIRLAVGAARPRLVRQLLTESAILALLGAAAGLLVARWGTSGLVALIATEDVPVALDLAIDRTVLGFTAAVAALTATLFGLVPAWRATRVSPQTAMRAGGRGIAEGHRRFTIGRGLVVAQVALSLVLLVGAGLLVGSLRNLRTLDAGFRPDGVLLVRLDMSRVASADAYRGMHRELLERVRAVPGIRSASASDLTPIGRSSRNDVVLVEGFEPSTMEESLAWFNEVSDGYFATMDMRLLAGRDFDASDAPGAPRAAVISESVARRFFRDATPLGRQFRTQVGDGRSDPYTVVGVVEEAKYRNLRETESGTIFLAASQDTTPGPSATLEIRADGDLAALGRDIQSVVAGVHPAITIETRTLARQVASSLRRERMLAVLSALFGGVALLLSMLGLYGVMAYAVARRRNEIGVRIALGADRGRVLRLVLGDAGRVVAAGVVIGVASAMALGTLVRSFLFGVEPTEPAVLALAVALLASVAIVAGLVPAVRAARMDPVAALREE
ncbi:MAG TPA: ABC transporter permease [Gemmatimonadaceae bacterium]